MKPLLILVFSIFFSYNGYSQVARKLKKTPDPAKKLMTVEASCGECNFGLDGKDCDLAVRYDGNAYYVDGLNIQEYGHPHNPNGFCVAVRKAEVQGEVINGRFKATYFKLLDVAPNQPADKKNKEQKH